MMDFLSPANEYSEAITAIATVVISVFSIVTVVVSSLLFLENRRMRKIGLEPNVIASLCVDDKVPEIINIVLVNVGRGPAKDVEFYIELDEEYFGNNNKVFTANSEKRTPFDFLLQDEKIITALGGSFSLFQLEVPPFEVHVKWKNLKGAKSSAIYTLDISQFQGLIQFNRSTMEDIKKSIDELGKILERLSNKKSPF